MAPLGSLGTSLALLIAIAADPEALPFVAPPLVIGAIVALLSWRFGTWSKVLAAVWGVFALAQVPMTPMLEGLGRPDSLFDFVPAWLFVLSAVTALVGGVLGVARRAQAGPAEVERRWVVGVGAIVALMVAVSGIASTTSDSALTAEERAGAIEVVMTDSEFTPSAIEVPVGEATFAVRNEGNVLHTFTIDELDIDEALSPGQEVLVTATVEAGTDTLVLYCRPHSIEDDDGLEGMFAELTIS